jgi:hypothetical protein
MVPINYIRSSYGLETCELEGRFAKSLYFGVDFFGDNFEFYQIVERIFSLFTKKKSK